MNESIRILDYLDRARRPVSDRELSRALGLSLERVRHLVSLGGYCERDNGTVGPLTPAGRALLRQAHNPKGGLVPPLDPEPDPDDDDNGTSPTPPTEEPPVDDTARFEPADLRWVGLNEGVRAWLRERYPLAQPDPPDPRLARVRALAAGCTNLATVQEALAHAGLARVRIAEE